MESTPGSDWTRATAKLWGDIAREKAQGDSWRLLSWDTHSWISRCINWRISGDPDESWLQFVRRQFCPQTLKWGLSLGCGWGALERDAISLGICEYLDAYDVSPEAVATARAEASARRFRESISYSCVDLNEAVLTPNKYDICFAAAALHHINKLEHLLGQVAMALKPDGVFVVLEYVGPSRFQWSAKVERLMNDILAALPQSYRVSLRDGKVIRGEVKRPSVEDVVRVDPSEAIRSGEVLGLLADRFDVLYRVDLGGTLLQFVLGDIAGNFHPDDPKDRALLDLIVLFEETLIQEKVLNSDFVFIVARRARGGASRRENM